MLGSRKQVLVLPIFFVCYFHSPPGGLLFPNGSVQRQLVQLQKHIRLPVWIQLQEQGKFPSEVKIRFHIEPVPSFPDWLDLLSGELHFPTLT